MKLNLGCGFNKLEGFVNVDADSLCQPDLVHDLEVTPWPFQDNIFEEIVANHVLEHLGSTPVAWIQIWKEIWRVSKPEAVVSITVPHPRHDNFLIDPTHVRPIFPETLAMFDQMRNIRDFENSGQETKLGLMSRIDLEILEAGYDLVEPWASGLQSGQISQDQVRHDLSLLNNVCFQIRMKLRLVKPCRGDEWMEAQAASAFATKAKALGY